MFYKINSLKKKIPKIVDIIKNSNPPSVFQLAELYKKLDPSCDVQGFWDFVDLIFAARKHKSKLDLD